MTSIVNLISFRRRNSLSRVFVISLFLVWILLFSLYQKSFRQKTSINHSAEQFKQEQIVLEEFLEKQKNIENSTNSLSQELKTTDSEIEDVDNFFQRPKSIFQQKYLGEFGKAVNMPEDIPSEINEIIEQGWKNQQFNQYVSDLISVRRQLEDYRTESCKINATKFRHDLPKTSVIIIFFNEGWSTLLRSIHSVLDRSPDHLLEEIILVDDASDMDHLKKPLEDYISRFPKVKIIRAKTREGLIKARLLGAASAKAPVLTFLDSHIECTTGWLEPLLDRIAENPTIVPCPLIERINTKTFEYITHEKINKLQVGGFDWRLTFLWFKMNKTGRDQRMDYSEPAKSPTMAGGLFSIDINFFKKLGMYDPEFQIWGGENLELSFKTWMCGGSIEVVPCSRIGHIYREKSPYDWTPFPNVVRKNLIRLTEVWMDDYAKFYFKRTGKKDVEIGDISERVKLRKSLDCKSFDWYVKNIYPELVIPDTLPSFGEIRNLAFGNNSCLTMNENSNASLAVCHGDGKNQYFEFDGSLLQRDKNTLQYDGQNIELKKRLKGKEPELWTYDNVTMQIYHSSSDRCLSAEENSKIVMNKCSEDSDTQKWLLENYNYNVSSHN